MITFNTHKEFEDAVMMYLLNNMKIQFEQTKSNSGDKLLSVVLTIGYSVVSMDTLFTETLQDNQ